MAEDMKITDLKEAFERNIEEYGWIEDDDKVVAVNDDGPLGRSILIPSVDDATVAAANVVLVQGTIGRNMTPVDVEALRRELPLMSPDRRAVVIRDLYTRYPDQRRELLDFIEVSMRQAPTSRDSLASLSATQAQFNREQTKRLEAEVLRQRRAEQRPSTVAPMSKGPAPVLSIDAGDYTKWANSLSYEGLTRAKEELGRRREALQGEIGALGPDKPVPMAPAPARRKIRLED